MRQNSDAFPMFAVTARNDLKRPVWMGQIVKIKALRVATDSLLLRTLIKRAICGETL